MKPLMRLTSLTTLLSLLTIYTLAPACSRFTYTAPAGLVFTGRTMDWLEDIHTDLWALPAGIKRSGSNQPSPLTWTSKYGSLIASGYDMATTDGINTAGLDVNLLYLGSSKFPTHNPRNRSLSVLNWAQYFLDNYATVKQATQEYPKLHLNIDVPVLPDGNFPTVHLAITDKSGDNAIFEYVDGQLTVHHGKQYSVMTNEPTYDKQLALNDYWKSLNGEFLPGTARPEDRYVRASYYLRSAPRAKNRIEAASIVFSIARNVSVPFNSSLSKARPNVAPTLWASVADLKNRRYYFQETNKPNVFWVDLNNISFKKGSPIQRLALQNGQIYSGEVSKQFKRSASFERAQKSTSQH